MTTINTNQSAFVAQANLSRANSTVENSIAKLSSGNRIITPDEDVAGLAIGTSITTTIRALEIAVLNTEQARSVLNIADAGLSGITDILSRQGALASQSNSGSLSDTERAFLNQEFTALTAEIDRIVDSTNFNGITLLNGSIAGDASVSATAPASTTTNTAAVAATVAATAPSAGSYTTTGTIVSSGVFTSAPDGLDLSAFDDATIGVSGFGTVSVVSGSFSENGTEAETVEFETTINGNVYRTGVITATANGGNIADNTTITFTQVGGTSAFSIDTANALATGIDTSVLADTLATDLTATLADLSIYQTRAVSGLTTPTTAATTYNITAGSVSISSNNFDTTNNDFGTIGEITLVAGSDSANSISVTVNGTTFSTSDIGGADDDLQNGDTITLTGRNSGGDSTGETITITLTTLASTVDLTSATEVADFALALNEFFGVSPAGTVSTSAYTTVNSITGTNVTSVSVSSFDDATYQSEGFGTVTVAEFTENSTNAENVTFTTTLGSKTYTAALSASGNGGAFSAQTLTFTATDGSGSAFDVGIAASGTIGTIDTSALADTVATNITAGLASVDIYQVRTIGSVDATQVTNTVLEGLTASNVTITSNQFDTTNNTFGDIGSFTGIAGSDTANTLSVVLNGTTFNATDLGGADDVLSSADGTITLIGRDALGNDNNQRLTIDISTLTGSIDLTNQDEVTALTNALDNFIGGSSSSTGGLSFQVGSEVTDVISVNIASVATADIFLDSNGAATTLTIDTQTGAQNAITAIDAALNAVTARRADVGAAGSRFDFASSNLEASIANQTAAASSFLDVDLAQESTNFSTQQVKLQASVSVLSQANQLPRNLLQLLQN